MLHVLWNGQRNRCTTHCYDIIAFVLLRIQTVCASFKQTPVPMKANIDNLVCHFSIVESGTQPPVRAHTRTHNDKDKHIWTKAAQGLRGAHLGPKSDGGGGGGGINERFWVA